jgi:uncharacterized membrane protein SirB2
MIEFYPQIKAVHVFMVLLSGAVFAARGTGALLGARWPMAAPLRWTSVAIDTTLLTAALMLLTVLPAAMFANGWLAMKLGLLVAYVVLGTLALKRKRLRPLFYALALLTYAWMISIARAHHPLGIFHVWLA